MPAIPADVSLVFTQFLLAFDVIVLGKQHDFPFSITLIIHSTLAIRCYVASPADKSSLYKLRNKNKRSFCKHQL
jgi:hypothetical protein